MVARLASKPCWAIIMFDIWSPRFTSATLTMPCLSAIGLLGSYVTTPAGLPRAMPVTSVPPPMFTSAPLPAPVPSAWPGMEAATTKRVWYTPREVGATSFMLAMFSDIESIHVCETLTPVSAAFIGSKSPIWRPYRSACARAIDGHGKKLELGVHGLDHGLELQTGLLFLHHLGREAHVVASLIGRRRGSRGRHLHLRGVAGGD